MKQPRGAAGSDLLFFIFFIVVLGIVWSLTGGPERTISREGPFLNPPFPLGEGSAYRVPGVTIPSRNGSAEGENDRDQNALERVITRIRTGFGEITEEKSPYASSVSLSASRAKDSDARDEYVTIKINKNLEGRVPLSSWRIESSVTTLGSLLGNAAYLPYSGQVNTESPVAVDAGTTLYVITGRSPIGTSFRTNLCTGYFAQFQEFEPSLKEACPIPEDELASKVDSGFVPNDECIDFVEDIDRCTLILTEIPARVGAACQNFILEDLTYNGCVQAHKDMDGFYNTEWYIYLDRDQELWKGSRERIRLLDENGKVVAATSY